MRKTDCSRAPLVEAMRDGRLGVQERGSLERHLTICSDCSALQKDLDLIAETLRESASRIAPLAHQRGRAALLGRALEGGAARAPEPRRFTTLSAFAIACSFAIVSIAVGWWWGRASAERATHVVASSTAAETTVVPERGTRFERARSDGLDTIVLTTGALAITAGSDATEHLVVRTSDAKLSPKAAVFRVQAEEGKVRSVAVERGTVLVEYAGFIAVIPAGGSWRASDAPKKVSSDAPPPSTSAVAVAPATPARAAAVATSAPSTSLVPSRRHPSTVAPTPPVAPSARTPMAATGAAKRSSFSDAIHTLERGDFDRASNEMRDFVREHPGDARADEADYVRIVALQRAGRADAARDAAVDYLTRWPNGAHRREAKRIAD